jgi:hypothetical protein
MSNYSIDESSVRVDIFKESGKWCQTVAIQGAKFTGCDVHDSVKLALRKVVGNKFVGMTAVCLEPYHEFSHPIMFVIKFGENSTES